eukprot:4854235-Lingulodinium_polyedra.AAC.1
MHTVQAAASEVSPKEDVTDDEVTDTMQQPLQTKATSHCITEYAQAPSIGAHCCQIHANARQ